MGDPENTIPAGEPDQPETIPPEPAKPAPEAPQPEPPPKDFAGGGDPGPGPWYGTGRRKTSVARVYVRSGSGRLQVNGRPLEEYFGGAQWWVHAREPLVFIDGGNQYDADIRVSGGGSTGQAGAIRQGLARALAVAQPDLRPKLRKAGFLTRDSRMKERKKYGQKGARRRFQWTKR